MASRHKVFISYHHENDEKHRYDFEDLFNNKFDIMESRSVQIGDIHPNSNTEYIRQRIRDEYIRDATVIVVLIGKETWKRKHVDWEIYSGLRHTNYNHRCGLLGILLPTHKSFEKDYNPYTIPPRLEDNIECDFAAIYDWSKNPELIQECIHTAFNNRFKVNPDLSRPLFARNRSGDRWYE